MVGRRGTVACRTIKMLPLVRLSVCTTAFILLLRPSQAQLAQGIVLAAHVSAGQEIPPGTTSYGTPRTFSATIANFGTGGPIDGNATLVAGSYGICTAPFTNASIDGTTAPLSTLTPTFAVPLLNSIGLGTLGVVDPDYLAAAQPVIANATTDTQGSVTTGNRLAVISALTKEGLGNIPVQNGVKLTCTTATIPVGQYPAVTVYYQGLTVGGQDINLNTTGHVPPLSPAATAALAAFAVVAAPTTISSTTTLPALLPGASTPITAIVTNTDAADPLAPNGGTVTAYLGSTAIGSATTITSTSGKSATFTFPVTVPTGAASGSTPLTLVYSGTPQFLSATTGQNNIAAGPTLSVPYIPTFTATATPSTAPAGTSVSIAGVATTPNGGPAPTGAVTLTVNGVTTGPFTLTPGSGSTSTFAGNLAAPSILSGSPFPVTMNYTPTGLFRAGQPATFSLPVTAGPATVTATPTPANPGASAPVTVAGTVAGLPGTTPVGTVDIKLNGNTVASVPVTPDGKYSGSFNAPTTPGAYGVTATFKPSVGSTVGAGISPSSPLTVGPAAATITPTLSPNPAAPSGGVTDSGTVTTTSGTPAGGTVTVLLNGKPVGSAVVGANGKFDIPFTAPATPGDSPVLTTFTPAGASSPIATAPSTLTVSPPTGASLLLSLIPNVLGPNGLGALGGTVTLGSGSPNGGSVSFTLNGQPVASATVGPDGGFNIPFIAPAATGAYTLLSAFIPSGGKVPMASKLLPFTVAADGGGTGMPSNITIACGNGRCGFSFPNCQGQLVINVTASGVPVPTGNVTLELSGGKLGETPIPLGTEDLLNGVAQFLMESVKAKQDVLSTLVAKLTAKKTDHLTKDDIHDKALVPDGDFVVVHGDYTLTAQYNGNSIYAASSASVPFSIDNLCLAVALALKA
ncbi:hypothetical protein COCOBI_01-3620 [Coccomyxa sp. Obi]|nr:hypothetical protein COCOBI_01-3620 [Coccomyxa sp. Obi]